MPLRPLDDDVVEGGQGGLGRHQERVAVGEGDAIVGRAELDARRASGRVVEVDQARGTTQRLAEPDVRLRTGRSRGEPRLPQLDGRLVLSVRRTHDERREIGCGHDQAPVGDLGIDQHHPVRLTGGDHHALLVDQHPATVAGQPPRLDDGRRDALSAAGLDREAVDRGEGRRHPLRIGARTRSLG